MGLPKDVVKKIKKVVRESGYSQQTFAKRFGLAESAISRWASGERNPSLNSLKKIAKATNKPLSYFFEAGDFTMETNTDCNLIARENQNVKNTKLNVTKSCPVDFKKDFETLNARVDLGFELLTVKLDLVLERLKKRE
ncbi:MAG: helix-turn-helix domain-containing protein [Endomicrobium sp.]|nr:helix-turn-helix domain-containing protein [Endomicrobium sp.]